ncbi:hypothetical protein Zm00014a_042942 [Zea mays]|uniref:Uncharacterized protein n=1 Tax=Zea mays TaxID=4577 RepID=A0A3L6F8M4_MAIZE|nr:hypothetical protein Zm00014a_042942 [Zea mays]
MKRHYNIYVKFRNGIQAKPVRLMVKC